MTRLAVLAASGLAILVVGAGCASEQGDEPEGSGDIATPHATASPSPGTASARESSTLADSVNVEEFPIPRVASAWQVRDIARCEELGVLDTPELFVRVPLATPDCVKFSEANNVLVVAATRVEVGVAVGEPVDVPGFNGEVKSIMAPLSRGVVYHVQPSGLDVSYLVVWDGGSADRVDQVVAELVALR